MFGLLEKILPGSPENQFEKAFPILISGAFLVIGVVGIVHHEMWRDEVQAWLIAKDCPDLSTVLQIIKYEGHPALWYIMLHFLSKLTSNLLSFQLFHLAIAAMSVYVFVAFAPFSRIQKLLFAFGYFPLYEYAIISRNYAIGILFVFILCALYPHRRRMYAVMGLVLALLANSNVYGTIIAISLFLTLVLDFVFQTWRSTDGEFSRSGAIIGFVTFVIGLIVAVYQITPNQDSCFAGPWHFFFHQRHFIAAVSTLYTSYVPLPNMNFIDFWNSNFLAFSPSGEAVMPYISLALAAGCILSLYREPFALILYLASTMGVMLFTYLVYFGGLRHHGHLFIILVMCYWIASYYDGPAKIDSSHPDISWSRKTRNAILTSILCLHVISAAFAFYTDLRHPFSAGRAVADFIKGLGLKKVVVVGDGTYITTVGAYLNQQVYFGGRNRFGTFVVFDKKLYRPKCPELIEQTKRMAKSLDSDVILVLNEEIPCQLPDTKILPLMEVTDTIVSDERAYVYMLKRGS